ncbi:MAG TPA: tetratricopeptide repeat protein [Terriglobales bacterium]|nr:tetratricopeptide repeat protein [Terriglobales bacterium]
MPEMDWTQEEIYLLADRGYALYRQGRYQEAAVIFEGLTVLDPLNSYCRTALAAVCLALGEPQRAVDELSFLLNLNPADHGARARRCEAYCQLGNWDGASQDLAILRRNGERHHVRRLAWRLQAAGISTGTTI